MGAEIGQLESYSKLWHDRNCSTVVVTAPILALASDDATTLGEVAITACREAARLIRLGEWSEMGYGKIPIIVHVLSHGGCQLLEEMEKRVREVVAEENSPVESDESSSRPQSSMPAFRKMTSTKSFTLSTASTDTYESDEEDHDDDATQPTPQNLLIPTTRERVRAARERPRLGLGYRLPNNTKTSQLLRRRPRSKKSPRVTRVDVERSAFKFSSIPTYNLEDRAYQMDMELFASRLALGTFHFQGSIKLFFLWC
jgi:hypothetical protein